MAAFACGSSVGIMMNPYESTNTKPTYHLSRLSSGRIYGIYIIQLVLIVAIIACLLSVASPWIRNWARPRFGSIGLSVCGNPVILLMLRKPTRVAYLSSTVMFLGMGLLNARPLLETGTVFVVANQFTDRLHSSWLWCVFPCLFASIYLAWLAASAKQGTLQLTVGEQSDGHEAADQPL